MASPTCPWWLGCLLASPLRRLIESPQTRLAPYVRPGMLILEPGPGMGFFTLELARWVEPRGHVSAAAFQASLTRATTVGFTIAEPAQGRELRVLLRRPAG